MGAGTRFRDRSGHDLPGAQECQGVPPTPVLVRLDQPVGDRTLLDGGREPPAEPPICANRDSCE